MQDIICNLIINLPNDIQKEIYKFIFTKCNICFRKLEFWNVYYMKDIYYIRMENYSFTSLYLFLNNNKKLCAYCYSMMKYWFR